jgi:adenine-specific DNA methylase
MVWDFAEAAILSDSTGSLTDGLGVISKCVEAAAGVFKTTGQVATADARQTPVLEGSGYVWFTDPPYYDAVPYADLSDCFFVWLRRTLPNHPLRRIPLEAGSSLTPKCPEIVQDEVKRTQDGRTKDKILFEQSMGQAFARGRLALGEEGIGAVVFAHKTTEGWEALISGLLEGGWTVTGSWKMISKDADPAFARPPKRQ